MAPLAARASSDDASNNVASGGIPHDTVVSIAVGILLGGAALAAFLIFGFRKYRALIKKWKNSRNASSVPSTPAIPVQPERARGGGTQPTASLPRFAHNLSAAMHLPLSKSSTQSGRPTWARRGSSTGMGPLHTRRGSNTSTNSTAGLLPPSTPKSSVPTLPKPAFLGRGVATGQGLTR